MKLDLTNIPKYMHEEIQGYVNYGWRPGAFLHAVLCNNLIDAATEADTNNIQHLHDYARLLYNELPRASWGNADKIESWVYIGGLGKYKRGEG